jgi:predicted MPP superfamily phosphohydrolase
MPKRFLTAYAVILSLGISSALYAFCVEPYWIEVTRHHAFAPLASPLKIAHLTDLHTHGLGRRERYLLHLLETERPDLIVITGDTVFDGGMTSMFRNIPKHPPHTLSPGNAKTPKIKVDERYRAAGKLLKRLHAPLGIWLVHGNWEHWWPASNEPGFYQAVGVHLLRNTGQQLRDDVWILGLEDAVVGSPDLDGAQKGVPPDAFKIVLFHSPAYFDQVAGRCNLVFAGHTHGGQVRLPFFKPFWLPSGCGRFLEGWYEQEGSRMYVSRGIGTSSLDVRFLCRPELAFITVGR